MKWSCYDIYNIYLMYRAYRYAASHQFICWIHNRLGKKVQTVTPSCPVNAIQKKYLEPDGFYIGFRDGEEICEYDSSWIFQFEESEL